MSHYFSEKPNVKSNKKNINYSIKEKNFNFITDNGVFSKTKVDFGTDIMLKVILENTKIKENFDILDIGCGYGVVSTVIKTFYPLVNITLSDVNERALKLSKENLENHFITEYDIVKSSAFDNLYKKFDIIISNPPIRAGKNIIFSIYEGAFDHLKKNGEFYCVIQTKHGAKSTKKKLEEIFSNCETLSINSGYRIFKSIKETE